MPKAGKVYRFIKKILLIARIILILGIVFCVAFYYIKMDFWTLGSQYNDMAPSIRGGSKVLVYKHPSVSSLFRFDIVFYLPKGGEGKHILGRIIGIPGETISSDKGDIFINGKKIEQSFYPPDIGRSPMPEDIPQYKVPEGCYFILVDNRLTTGNDSREFGAVPFGNIESKLLVKF